MGHALAWSTESAAGYVPDGAGFILGENLGAAALGLATPAEVVGDWVGNPERLADMLRPDCRETGMAVSIGRGPVVVGGQRAGVVYTEEFGLVVQGG